MLIFDRIHWPGDMSDTSFSANGNDNIADIKMKSQSNTINFPMPKKEHHITDANLWKKI
jgi:hypothetical protein